MPRVPSDAFTETWPPAEPPQTDVMRFGLYAAPLKVAVSVFAAAVFDSFVLGLVESLLAPSAAECGDDDENQRETRAHHGSPGVGS
jgi:hypothetical protein